MAGIQLGSSFRLSSPVPHLANASFADAPTRLAAGQLRHVSWHYSQESPDAHYRIFPLAACFLADGVTPATQFGTWGTLEAHWRIVPLTSDDLPESATPANKYYTAARAALKADLVNGMVPASQLPPAAASTAPAQATATTLGTVKGGGTGNVTINADGSITATAAAAAAAFASITGAPADNTALSTALGLKVDKVTGLALSSNDYTSPEKTKLAGLFNPVPATAATAGVVKIGTGVTVAADGTISVATGTGGTAYTLPQASPTVLGGLKLGNNLALNASSGQVDAAAATFLNILGQPSDNANLSTALYSRFNNRGAWAASTIYQPNDVVSNSGTTYYNAGAAFTSGTSFLIGNWTSFASPLYSAFGSATDGPITQAAVTNAFLQLQYPIVATYADGTVQYFMGWPARNDAKQMAQIRIRGNFGDPNGLYVIQSYTSLFIEAGAVFTCNRLIPQAYASANPVRAVIAGTGTLLGNIVIYDNTPTVKLLITGIRHEGTFFNDVGSNVIAADVKWTNVSCLPPAGYAYLNTYSRNGAGNGCFYFRYRFYQCRFEVSGTSPATVAITNARPSTVASAFQLSAFNYTLNATQDASDKANCQLEAFGCTFVGDGTSSNPVLASYGGFATLRFAQNTITGISAPPDATDPTLSAFGIGSGDSFAALTYAASIALDFAAATVQTLAATGNVTLTTANRAVLRYKQITITNTTAAAITIVGEAWAYLGLAPVTSLAAGKKIKLTVQCLGPNISDVEAANQLFI